MHKMQQRKLLLTTFEWVFLNSKIKKITELFSNSTNIKINGIFQIE